MEFRQLNGYKFTLEKTAEINDITNTLTEQDKLIVNVVNDIPENNVVSIKQEDVNILNDQETIKKAEDDLLRNVEILNKIALNESIKEMELNEEENTRKLNEMINESNALNAELSIRDKKRLVYNACETKDEWEVHKAMVEVDKIATWDDILIKQRYWDEHDDKIRKIINVEMLLKGSDKKLKMSVYNYLIEKGYSDRFCKVTAIYYLQMFQEDIETFRSLSHTFTSNDIKLEITATSDKQYMKAIQHIVLQFNNKKISLPQLVTKLQILMIKKGFSNPFIDYTIKGFIRELLSTGDEDKS